MMQRYGVDEANARHVEETARHLFASVQDSWSLDQEDLELLEWAARLHEVGLAISHSHFHKHGQYLVENSDLAGFSTAEQTELGLLIRGHRQKFPQGEFELKGNGVRVPLERLCLLLRMAVLFRFVAPVDGTPPYHLEAQDKSLTLKLPKGWLQHHPLTRNALDQEQTQLAKIGYTLAVAKIG